MSERVEEENVVIQTLHVPTENSTLYSLIYICASWHIYHIIMELPNCTESSLSIYVPVQQFWFIQHLIPYYSWAETSSARSCSGHSDEKRNHKAPARNYISSLY